MSSTFTSKKGPIHLDLCGVLRFAAAQMPFGLVAAATHGSPWTDRHSAADEIVLVQHSYSEATALLAEHQARLQQTCFHAYCLQHEQESNVSVVVRFSTSTLKRSVAYLA